RQYAGLPVAHGGILSHPAAHHQRRRVFPDRLGGLLHRGPPGAGADCPAQELTMGAGLGGHTPVAILFRQVCQLLLPRRCPLCGRVLAGVAACPDCALELKIRARWQTDGPHAPPPALGGGIVAWAAAPFWYAGGIREA